MREYRVLSSSEKIYTILLFRYCTIADIYSDRLCCTVDFAKI